MGDDETDASLSCLIADRAWDGDAFRAWLAPKGIKAAIPARHRRTNPQLHDPARYKARHAAARGLDWLKGWQCVTTRYDKYAHRFLGFLCLATAWIWLTSQLNTIYSNTERNLQVCKYQALSYALKISHVVKK